MDVTPALPQPWPPTLNHSDNPRLTRPQTRKWKHTFQHDVTLKPTDKTFSAGEVNESQSKNVPWLWTNDFICKHRREGTSGDEYVSICSESNFFSLKWEIVLWKSVNFLAFKLIRWLKGEPVIMHLNINLKKMGESWLTLRFVLGISFVFVFVFLDCGNSRYRFWVHFATACKRTGRWLSKQSSSRVNAEVPPGKNEAR